MKDLFLRIVSSKIYDYVNAINEAEGIIETPQETFKKIREIILANVKNRKDVRRLIRSLSYCEYQKVIK
jgi:ferritin